MGEVFITRRGGGSGDNPYSDFPDITYSGTWSGIIDDGKVNGVQHWKAKFYSSGILTFLSNPPQIDVFLVGGGGAATYRKSGNGGGNGGGGGEVYTNKQVTISKNTNYEIIIGAGGANNTSYQAIINGNPTSAFGFTANGGGGGEFKKAGDGGSGGGGGYDNNGNGGEDGGNGTPKPNSDDAYRGGLGKGLTTREFGEATGELYAGGGGGTKTGVGGAGGGGTPGVNQGNGTPNTGGGGAGQTTSPGGAGGSGVVVIRDTRFGG